MVDVKLWMKAVEIDAYYQLMCNFGVKKGADLEYIGDDELQVYMCCVALCLISHVKCNVMLIPTRVLHIYTYI